MKQLFFFMVILVHGLKGQDTIRFRNGEVKAVKVQEVGLNEIKYNRFDNLTGPMYVCGKEEINYIRYANGAVDLFGTGSVPPETPKTETVTANPPGETPAYVNNTPASPETQFEKINIAGRRLYYRRKPVSEKTLLGLIKNHPDQERRGMMLREFSKIPIYKNNRMIGVFLYAGGATACFGALVAGSAPVFVIASAAVITGCILATVNKNKRYKKRVEIARLYNGDQVPANMSR